jgi:hypothetical protein
MKSYAVRFITVRVKFLNKLNNTKKYCAVNGDFVKRVVKTQKIDTKTQISDPEKIRFEQLCNFSSENKNKCMYEKKGKLK